MSQNPRTDHSSDPLAHPLDAVEHEEHDLHQGEPHSGESFEDQEAHRLHDVQEQVLARIERDRKRRPKFMDDRITMAHGAGGKASRQLVEGLFVPKLRNDVLSALNDAALVQVNGTRLAMTTDSFVVKPILFPGGSIGELAINGTVNDLAVSGAKALWISAAVILEEGLPAEVVKREANALAAAAERAGVSVVTGDTKVVERGKCDEMYVNTTGIGLVVTEQSLDAARCRPGDKVLVSGYIGDHGTAIMLTRGELEIDSDVVSDTASLWPVAETLINSAGDSLRCMRDATRGGVATVLNEIAMSADVGIVIAEGRVPVRPEVTGACELLGIDPLHMANEGKLVAFIAPEAADAALEAVRAIPGGEQAALVGEVREEPPGRVLVKAVFGGHRIIDMLVGDPLPRIC
ncbi:MAG: hydrogenase expression/formation protein HypE [Actinomycetota bacterium]